MYCDIFNIQEVGFHRPGSIRLLSTPGRVKEAEYAISRAGWHGPTPMWLMTPDEIAPTAPFMNMDGIEGGLWTPGRRIFGSLGSIASGRFGFIGLFARK